MLYKTHFPCHSLLAKRETFLHAISRKFKPYAFLFWSSFKKASCILHHFTLLFWLPARNFSAPIIRI